MPKEHKSKSKKKTQEEKPSYGTANFFIGLGIFLIVASLGLFGLIFRKVLYEEYRYYFANENKEAVVVGDQTKAESEKKNVMVALDQDFGIVIPKIGANAPIIADVDPYNEDEYQYKLSKGVAHAKDTTYPGQNGNTFLFAHSAGNFYEANKYNAVFYLLNKMEEGDDIYIFHNRKKYKYEVTETKLVQADEVEYLSNNDTEPTLTLMTCWPAGTTLQRLLVFGRLVELEVSF